MVKFKGSARVILIAEPEESFDLNVRFHAALRMTDLDANSSNNGVNRQKIKTKQEVNDGREC